MSLMKTLTTPELEDVAADEWLDYDIRIEAQSEIYRRLRTPEGVAHDEIEREK